MTDSYAELRQQKGLFSYGLRRRTENVEILLRQALLPDRAKILDVGTADGEMLRHLQAVYPQYDFTGIERTPELVEIAQSHGLHVVQSDARSLPFPEESFDAITMISTIKHIPQYQQVFAECHRVLKDQGIMIIAEPSRIALGIGLKRGHFDPQYLPNRWSLKQMEVHLVAAGFQTCAKKKYMLAPFAFPGSNALEKLFAACGCSCLFLHQAIMVKKATTDTK